MERAVYKAERSSSERQCFCFEPQRSSFELQCFCSEPERSSSERQCFCFEPQRSSSEVDRRRKILKALSLRSSTFQLRANSSLDILTAIKER
ncbi:hypothetical protein ACKFKF_01505 [Phormidesmis sp. 146-12]